MSVPAATSLSRPSIQSDLVAVLRAHAECRPDQAAYCFLADGQTESVLTYFELDRRARAVAGRLQDMGLAGERVLLAYPQGLDFIAGFFGCLYAGCVAVPMCLPQRRTLDRFLAIAADAGARHALSTCAASAQFRGMAGLGDGQVRPDAAIAWIDADKIPSASAVRWKPTDVAPDTLAMLQYTSGSTSEPKGVMISHANLMHNARSIHEAFGVEDAQDIGVFWLPMYHDMGLVGAVVEPMLAGVRSMLMAPSAFLQHPIAWLAAISKHRATISGAPNFAYDLCARKITDEQRATLDLSSWTLAFVGAEPIHPGTLERFAAAFAPCGFNPKSFYPCYGMAEATLMISGPPRGRGAGPTIGEFDEAALSEGRVESVARPAGKTRRLVSCGAPIGDLRVAIVESPASTPANPGRVGEVWLSGASIGQGYWRSPEQTRVAFDARLNDAHDGPFLRTGDLGFVFEGELYIIGRADDMIIVRGRNHHPQDLEATARGSHPLLQAGVGAAFAIDDQGRQELVLVHEVTHTGRVDLSPVVEACREAVLAAHGLALNTIALVRCGTIPKTSSGKVQRRACRAAFIARELKPMLENRFPGPGEKGAGSVALVAPPSPGGCIVGTLSATVAPNPSQSVLATVCQHALAIGGVPLSSVTPQTPLTALGLDSLQRVELAAALEKTFACRLPDKEFNPAQTLGDLAEAVQVHLTDHPCAPAAAETPVDHFDFARFPEYIEFKRYEHMLRAVAGENPYFRVDQGCASSGGLARIAGREVLNFGVYDYVGMAHEPAVRAAAKGAIDRYGVSAGASRLVSGEKQVHRDLEQALAAFLGTASAITFVSGHATNVTTIGHLAGPEDLVVYDALAHNSIIQGAQLSGATRRAFAHNDFQALDALLTDIRRRHRRVLIAIEGVYSMDGDFPDLARFIELKKKHRALLLVDEAHSLGIMGPTGRGIGEHWGVARTDIDLWMGTLSKSLASCGGYIAGSAALVEYLAYTAPGFVYSVGLSPPNAAAALAALTLLRSQPQRVSRLRELSALFLSLAKERGLNTGLSAGTPVVPVILGNSVKCLRLAKALFERGINVQPILPPAVPEHSARLRFFITTNHTEAQIRDTVGAVADELARL